MPNFFWVNQGQTYAEERNLGCLWAPYRDSAGSTPHHWRTMQDVRPGDLILNYCGKRGGLQGYCIAQSEAFDQAQPEFGTSLWQTNGLMVTATYHPFPSPLSKLVFMPALKDLLPAKYSPMTNKGNANQGYLYRVDEGVASAAIRLAGLAWEPTNGVHNELAASPTEALALVSRRVTQAKFRIDLIERWNGQCAVTGCSQLGLLVASHIVPWRHASDVERNDPDNGLLLSPVYDRLFDQELITFDRSGRIRLSKDLKLDDIRGLGVTGHERIDRLTEGHQVYLERHRAMVR